MSTPIAQTYLYVGAKCYFVSTIDRQSSATLAYVATYAETMAWEFDTTTKQRGRLVMQDEASTGSLFGHVRVMEAITKEGGAG